MIRHTCPSCFEVVELPENQPGPRAECPACSAFFELPSQAITNAPANNPAAAADPPRSGELPVGFGAFPNEDPSDLVIHIPPRRRLIALPKLCALCGAPQAATETLTNAGPGSRKVSIDVPFCKGHRSGQSVVGCLVVGVVVLGIVFLSVAAQSRGIMVIGGLIMAAVSGFWTAYRNAIRSRLQFAVSQDNTYVVVRGGCDAFADAVRSQQEERAWDLARALRQDGLSDAAIVQRLGEVAGWPADDAAAIVDEIRREPRTS